MTGCLPEPGGVRGQHLITEDNAAIAASKLEFGVRQQDAALGCVVDATLVNFL